MLDLFVMVCYYHFVMSERSTVPKLEQEHLTRRQKLLRRFLPLVLIPTTAIGVGVSLYLESGESVGEATGVIQADDLAPGIDAVRRAVDELASAEGSIVDPSKITEGEIVGAGQELDRAIKGHTGNQYVIPGDSGDVVVFQENSGDQRLEIRIP